MALPQLSPIINVTLNCMEQLAYRLMRACWGNRVRIPDKGHYCNASAKPEYPACSLEWLAVNPGCALARHALTAS